MSSAVLPFTRARNESIKCYKIKHAFIWSSAVYFAQVWLCKYVWMYTLKNKSIDVPSLSELPREFCCSLPFQNHILQVSQIFPVTGTNRPLSGSLWWPQWPRKCCEVEEGFSLGVQWCFSLVWEAPIGRSALLSFAKELLSFPARLLGRCGHRLGLCVFLLCCLTT